MTTMDRETLLERLRGIEWDDFEVKEAAGGVPKTAYTTVSAFANTAGGWIVFGVKEAKGHFEVTGVSQPDDMQNEFVTTCRSTEKFSRLVEVRPHQFALDGRTVLAFYISPARRFDKPIRVRVDKAWFAYIRVAAGDQRCTPEEEGRFLRDATIDTFDAQVMPGARFEDLDETSIRWVRGLYQSRHLDKPLSDLSHADFLDELGLLQDGQVTYAAALFLGKRKLIGRIKPAGIVDFRQIRLPWAEEVPAHRYDDRLLSEGNLVETLQAVLGKILNLVPNPFRLNPTTLQREANPPEYPALREALVNLLIHQDYADQHRTARILWYTDRTLFDNPGDSFVALSAMLDGGVSDLRNPRIARLMRLIGYAEQVGTGMSTIVRTWRAVDRTPPVIVNDPGRKTYAITLSWVPALRISDATWRARIGATVSPDEARLLAWLREVGNAPRAAARLATGATARETRAMIEHLLVNRLIETADDEGELICLAAHIREILDAEHVTPQVAPQVTPQVTPQVDPPVTPPVDPPVQALLVLLEREGPLGSKAIREALGLKDRTHVREAYVQTALDAGLVEMTRPKTPQSRLQQYRLTDAGRALLDHRRGDHR